jgi:2-dehydro-3-deoxyglucarate aldolase/4-hydroxy-2-oxoheptanedioate aldolase
MEHSGFSFETLKQAVRYFEAADLPAVVRPPSKGYSDIALAKDMGAEALLLPHVRNEEEARSVVSCSRYPPDGVRGAAFQIAHDRYAPGAFGDKLAEANATGAVFCTIENLEGLENVEAIAGVDGVDGLFVGHTDLSASLGIVGQYDHPDFRAAEARVAETCVRLGKSYGRVPSSIDDAARLVEAGANMLICSGDIWLLFDGLREQVGAVRARLADQSASVEAS